MAEKRILLMRHAEKPPQSDNPYLSAIGSARAQALPKRIAGILNGSVDFIFAAKPSAHSVRPLETVTTQAQSSQLEVKDSYGDKDYGELANHLSSEAMYTDKNIVVCWHHDMIPDFAKALGAPVPSMFVSKWPADEFNRIFSFEYGHVAAPRTTAIN
jgi:hypothetical protein